MKKMGRKIKENNIGLLENQKEIQFRKTINFPSTTHATFGLYRYPAKFIPHVIAYILLKYSDQTMTVFDPFAGYGTVGVVSRIYGNPYELWDLNPLLDVLHKISIMRPISIKEDQLFKEMSFCNKEFLPDWSRLEYWYPKDFISFLSKIWGYYHSLLDEEKKLIITIPLLKVSRYFSYDDAQRQKLSRSKKSLQRVARLLDSNWKEKFYELLSHELKRVVRGINEYQELSPKNVNFNVYSGVDSLKQDLKREKDILITSPPYLQSQEYIRQAKLDLFWLGYKEDYIKKLSKLEIPYRDIDPTEIYSRTYEKYLNNIKEDHIRNVFQRYFWGVLGALSRLQKKITTYMFLFVGHASSRGISVPIDRILIEHFAELGWKHEITLIDKIVSRRLFSYKVNPATGITDARTKVENLIILKRN